MCSFRQAGIKQHLSNSGLDYGRLQREIINKYPAKWNLIATVTHTQSYSPINKVNVQPTYHLLQSTLFWEHVDEAKHLTFNVFTQTPYAQAPIYSLKYPKVFTFSSAQFDPVDFLQFNSTWRKRLVKKRKKNIFTSLSVSSIRVCMNTHTILNNILSVYGRRRSRVIELGIIVGKIKILHVHVDQQWSSECMIQGFNKRANCMLCVTNADIFAYTIYFRFSDCCYSYS